ncbi:MAG: protein rep [Shewanella sp.]|nr:protein rep [Shewanella sp.]
MSLYDSLPREQGTGVILQDNKTDFRKQKLKSIAVAEAMTDSEFEKRRERMSECGSYLSFAVAASGDKRLFRANFCKDRMCPACQRRRSLVIFHQVKNVSKAILSDFPTYKFLLLTLTVPNVPASQLGAEISHMAKSWHRLIKRKDFQVVKGWFRTLEVTYNGERDDYHPHYHVLLCVPSNYFAKNYIKQERWLELWQQATRYPHVTQVDVRAVRPNPKRQDSDPLASAAAEVGKYATKPNNYLAPFRDGFLAHSQVVQELARGIHRRKLVAFGGIMLEYASKLDFDDADSDEVDLVHVDGDSAAINAVMVHIYRWNVGLKNYIN